MVLLARQALQEHFASKQQEGADSESIELGSKVAVLSGRNFPLFRAGDQGDVVRLDYEALNCDVLFEGATQPVPVALRHLRLLQPPLDSKHQVADGNENGARVQSASSSSTDFASSTIVFGESPASKGESATISVSDTSAWQSTLEEGPEANTSSSPNKRVTKNSSPNKRVTKNKTKQDDCKAPEGGASAEVFTFTGSNAFDGSSDAGTVSAALVAAVADADGCPVRLDTLEARIRQLLERHRAETEWLKSKLEKAVTFGRQQQERVEALERHIRKMHNTEPTPSTVSTVLRPKNAVASMMSASATAQVASSLTVSSSMLPIATEGNSSGAGTPARSCCDPSDVFSSSRHLRSSTMLASSASTGALTPRPASARLHLSATTSQAVAGAPVSPRLANSPSHCTLLGPSVTPPHPSPPLSVLVEPVALGRPGSGIAPGGSSCRALSASAAPTRWACQSVPTRTTAAPQPALFLMARPNGAMQQQQQQQKQQHTPRQQPRTPPGGATPVTPLPFVPGCYPGQQQQENVPTCIQASFTTCSGGALSPSRSGADAGTGMLTPPAAATHFLPPSFARRLPVGSAGSVHACASATGLMQAPAIGSPAAVAAAAATAAAAAAAPSFGALERG